MTQFISTKIIKKYIERDKKGIENLLLQSAQELNEDFNSGDFDCEDALEVMVMFKAGRDYLSEVEAGIEDYENRNDADGKIGLHHIMLIVAQSGDHQHDSVVNQHVAISEFVQANTM